MARGGARWRGSALLWDAGARVLTYRPPTRRPDTGWALAVDDAAPAALAHVRAELPYISVDVSAAPEIVDAYALIDDDGRLLAPALASGAREFFPGWYPPAAMQSLAEAVGVPWRDDRPSTWHDLNTRYPALLPHGRAFARSARTSVVVEAALAVMWLVLGLACLVLGVVLGPWWLLVVATLLLGLAALSFRNAAEFRRAVGGPGS